MEGRGFDDLARTLGRHGGRRALLVGLGTLAAARLAGFGPGVATRSGGDVPPVAAKKKKKKKCKPACVNGYTCVKVSRRKRECQCLAPGTMCGEYCCPEGQSCSGGACVLPSSPTPTATATATATPVAPATATATATAISTATPLPTATPVPPTFVPTPPAP